MGDFTNLGALFKLYNKVTKEKLGKILGLTTDDMNDLLDRYLKRRRINFNNDSAFFKTVLSKLYGDSNETEIDINDNVITIHEPEEEAVNYANEYSRCLG